MSLKLALIGITGKKSGGAFAKLIIEHIDEIKAMFPDGIKIIIRKKSDTTKLEMLLPHAEICYSDSDKENCYEDLLSDVDTVINVAGISLSKKISLAAAKNSVRRLILVHTTGIYSKHKAAGELYREIDAFVTKVCQDNNIVLTICRPTMIYGNIYDRNIVKFIKLVDMFPITPIVSNAMYKLQPVHYEDLAEAYFSILINEEKTANKNYILSGGEEIYLKDILKIIGAKLGKKVRFISCPFIIAYIGAWCLYLCTFRKKDYREKVQRLCEDRCYSYEDAAMDFGYKPRAFHEGIAEEVSQYLELKNK